MFAATARELEGYGGYFFNNCFNVEPSEAARSTELAKTLWDYSELMVLRAENRWAEQEAEQAVAYQRKDNMNNAREYVVQEVDVQS